ncbi:histidinol-phosphatase HisJ [Thalassobacillus sp. CUG 92003]|uniref:histidinol-phosphatase HisJ n=1 Tax=Thalassobacillus sp. CUG 92003 TaxID=2736641 RepID=UPI00351A2416
MKDGHVHSPYCPHGTPDSLNSYVERAIAKGYTALSFTEHAPLPAHFADPTPAKDSSMALNDIEGYIKDLTDLKQIYQNDIDIHTGLEVDFIEGYENETKAFLDQYGPYLTDSILSVHFLKSRDQYHCIDFSKQAYEKALHDFGGVDALYKAYFQTVLDSVTAELGTYKPQRIGHMTLVRKFHRAFPAVDNWEKYPRAALPLVKAYNMTLDYNGAGAIKDNCLETYPPLHIAHEASDMGIPLIYGSDAHHHGAIAQGYAQIDTSILTL